MEGIVHHELWTYSEQAFKEIVDSRVWTVTSMHTPHRAAGGLPRRRRQCLFLRVVTMSQRIREGVCVHFRCFFHKISDSQKWGVYSRVQAHRNHGFDPASVFLSTHWWSQHPACQCCFYKPLRNCHPSQRVSKIIKKLPPQPATFHVPLKNCHPSQWVFIPP